MGGLVLTEHDALLCPVGPVAAQPLSDEDLLTRTMTVNGRTRPANDLIRWPGLIGVAYLPSTVVPVGRTNGGLPSGSRSSGRSWATAPPWRLQVASSS